MIHEENQIQRNIVKYLRTVNIFVFSCPNGINVKNASTRNILQLSGLTSGVSDLIILHKGITYFCEVKTPKGKQLPTQKEFEQEVTKQGFEYIIFRSIDDAINFVGRIK